MAIEIVDLITPDGDISVLDRTGGRVNVTLKDNTGPIDISGWNIWFESATVSVQLTPDGTSQYFILTPEHVETLIDDKATRFAVINRTPDPDEALWEGFIFIRSVD